MISLYRVVSTLLYPLFIVLTYIRCFLKKEDPYRFKEKIFSSHFDIIKGLVFDVLEHPGTVCILFLRSYPFLK